MNCPVETTLRTRQIKFENQPVGFPRSLVHLRDLPVALIRVLFSAGLEKDFVEGRLDVNTFVLFDLLDYVAHGADLVAIINADYSAGAEKLIARPGIETLDEALGLVAAMNKKTRKLRSFCTPRNDH
jgi:hypothetical protein